MSVQSKTAMAGKVGLSTHGAIDCDVHPAVPDITALLPYVDDYWREQVTDRGIHLENFELMSFPASAPITCRPDWRPDRGPPGSRFDLLRKHALDHFGSRYAICNVLHGAMVMTNVDMAAAFCRAINQWLAAEWLDRDPRLRASIVVPAQNVELAVAEIERCAVDRRFVQVLMLAMGPHPAGRRQYWPIYEAAERRGLPVGFHAGSTYDHPPTRTGWASSYLTDYIAFGNGFESLTLSLISEGVFAQFPNLKVVLIESGVTWLPAFLWRANKTWRAARAEVPWMKEPPVHYLREHVRLTIQPIDKPPDTRTLEEVVEQLGSDKLLLFSTDYPHWQFDGDDVLPEIFTGALAQKILVDNPLDTYARLRESTAAPHPERPR